MANAKITQIEQVVTTTTDGVVLELTLTEARALYALTMRIGGDARETPRGLTDKIGIVLRNACKPGWDKTYYDRDPQGWAQPEYNLFEGSIKALPYGPTLNTEG